MGEALAAGRQPSAAHAAPAANDRVQTQPVMSPAIRAGLAAYGPRLAMANSRLVARLRVLPPPGRLPPSNQMPRPPRSTTHVSPWSSERRIAALGASRLPT